MRTAPREAPRPPLSRPRPRVGPIVSLATLLAVGALLGTALATPTAEPPPASRADAAARDAEIARQQREQQAQVLAARGRKFLAAGAYAEAREALREAVRLDPTDAVARKLLVTAESALGMGAGSSVLAQARERQAFKTQALLRQLELDLFEAEAALRGKDYTVASQRAERALAAVGYVDDPKKAGELRERAGKLLAEARAAGESLTAARLQSQVDRARADVATGKAQRTREQAAGLRVLNDQATKLLEAKEYQKSESIAEEMLRVDPKSKDAALLREKARRAALAPQGRRSRSPERLEGEAFLMKQVEEEFTMPKADVILSVDEKQRVRPSRERPTERWEAELESKLARTVTLEFRETPLAQAIEQLAAVGGFNAIIDPEAKPTGAVTMPSATMPLKSFLNWAAQFGGLRYCLRDGAVFLTSRSGMLDTPVSRVYDVSSLLPPAVGSEPVDLPGPIEPGPRPTQPVELDDPDPEPIGRGWVEFIRLSIAPDTWGRGDVAQDRQPFTIQYRNGRIVVVHTPEVQEQVEELLNNFRKARNLQVHILARFIQIDKAFLDKLNLTCSYSSGTKYLPEDTYGAGLNPSLGNTLTRFGDWGPSGGLHVTYTYTSDYIVNKVLDAVIAGRKGTVLQAPRLTCFNTQRANMQVVRNVNYVRTVNSENVPEIGNIPDGIIFDVQPFVSADRRYITLVLQPQMRNLDNMLQFIYGAETTERQVTNNVVIIQTDYKRISLPTTTLRSLGTTVTVPNGGTLLLGGFTSAEERSEVSTAPFLEGIPLLRFLARGWERLDARSSLIMLITAQTVDDIFEEE